MLTIGDVDTLQGIERLDLGDGPAVIDALLDATAVLGGRGNIVIGEFTLIGLDPGSPRFFTVPDLPVVLNGAELSLGDFGIPANIREFQVRIEATVNGNRFERTFELDVEHDPVVLLDGNGRVIESFTNIQAAVDRALEIRNGTVDGIDSTQPLTIEISGRPRGAYEEQVVIQGIDDLTLTGCVATVVDEDTGVAIDLDPVLSGPATIDGAVARSGVQVQNVVAWLTVVDSDNVRVEDLTFDGGQRAPLQTSGQPAIAGIVIGGNGIEIEDNIIQGFRAPEADGDLPENATAYGVVIDLETGAFVAGRSASLRHHRLAARRDLHQHGTE